MSLISAPPPLYDQQRKLASDLMSSLELSLPPIAVSFCDHVVPADPQFLDSDALVPLADRVPHRRASFRHLPAGLDKVSSAEQNIRAR